MVAVRPEPHHLMQLYTQILNKLAKTKVVRKTMEMSKRKMRVVALVRVLANLK